MARQFSTIKRSLTREEKKQVVNSHKKFNLPLPDNHTYQSFMKADIQDEFIIMKCCNCKNEVETQADFIRAYLDHYKDQEYPEGICKICGGTTIPLDVYNEKNK